MDFKSWFHGWSLPGLTSRAKRPRRPGRKTLLYAKLRLDELESRLAPAAVSWTGNAGTLNWGDANNWSNTAVPGSADDVTISKAGVGTINISAGSYAVDSLNDTTAGLSIASTGSLSVAGTPTTTFGQNVTVAQGATLTFGAGVNVLIQSNVTLTDSGTMTLGFSGDQVTFGVGGLTSNTTEQLVVSGGGVLNASGATFSAPSAYNSSYTNAGSINVAVNGQFTPTSCAVSVPVYLPAANVPALGGGNLSFQDIDILGGSLASGSVGLNVICTNTTNLRYVFSSNFTVALGATLTVASGLPVLIQSSVTLTDSGTMTFRSGDQVTFGVGGLTSNTTEQLAVSGGGVLSASAATFSAPSAYNSSYMNTGSINVAVNGQFTPTSCAFNVPVYLPAANVPGLGSNNLSFQDIDILGGSLASGSVAFNVICTNTTNLRYVFSSNFTVALGATLTVAASLPVLIQSNVTVTDSGTMTFGSGDQVTFGVGGLTSNTTEQLVVSGGGVLSASGATFSAPSAYNSSYMNTGSINVAVNGQFTPTSCAFNVPVYLPAANVPGLGSNNLSFQDIDILGGSLASGSVAFNVICTNTTNLRYVFSSNFTVALGATLTVAASLPVLIQSNVTVTDSGTMTFGSGDQVTFGVGGLTSNTTEQLAVSGGGVLSASAATFSAPSAYNSSYMNTGSINVAVNGQFTPTSCAFNVPVYLPAANVPGLGSNNLSFQDIDILGGSLASGSVAFNVICTNTTNLRYVFSSNFTVALGATLTVAASLPVLIQSNVTVTDSGTMTFGSGDQVTFGVGGLTSNTTEQLVVSGGGVLSASGATFSAPSAYNSSYMNTGSINVAVNGQFTPTSCAFNVPVYLPAANVPGLGSNNLSFQDIDILGGSLASGSVAFNVICTNTTNLRYVFSSNFTVALGATLTVAASLPVLIQSNVTVTDSGTMTFGSGDQVTFGVGGLTSNTTEQLAVSGGGVLSASGATFSAPSAYNSSYMNTGSINVAVNGQFTPTSCAFNVPVYLPAANVPGLGSNNLSFQDIDILGGSLASGSVAFNVICTNTTNLRYVFSSNFTVALGATLTVAANVPVLIAAGVTLTNNGTLTYAAGDTVIFAYSSGATTQIAVGSGGVLNASGAAFTAASTSSNTTQINVNAGGQFIANGDTFTLTTVTLSSGSTDSIQNDTFSSQFAINSGASWTINQNNFSNVPASGIIAAGSSTATIDLTNNYWGTTVAAQIAAKIVDHITNSSLPTVLYQPYLSLEPAQTTAAAGSATYNTAAQNVTLNATVTSPPGVVSQGTETFTVLSGSITIGNPVTVNVSSGVASATYALPAATAPGTYTIQAVYNGTSFFSSATDSSHSLTVGTATTTTAAANASTTYAVGSQSVSLSASVTSPAGTVNGGTETFTILSGSTPVGNAVTVNVSSGAASASYTLPAATALGTYTIQAVYNGTTNFGGSTDAGHSLTVAATAISWTGNAGTLNWSDPANWSTNVVPGSLNDVTINQSGVGTITVGAGTYAVRSLNDTTAVLSIASGGTLTLAAVAATSTFGQNVTVQSGATLTVGMGASVLLGPGVTLTDNGTVTFGNNDTVVLGVSGYNGTEQIVVGSGGVLTAGGTGFSAPLYYNFPYSNTGTISVVTGGQFTPTTSTFTAVPVYLPAVNVAQLGSTNVSFGDIDILGGTLGSGSVALNVLCMNPANLRYVFSSNFTVAPGATLTVAPNVSVAIASGVTLTDNGTVSFGANDAVVLGTNSYTTEQIAVGNGGVLSASSTGFTAYDSTDTATINVTAGGHFTSSNSTFVLNQIDLNSGSILNAGDFVGNSFNSPLYLPATEVQYLSGPGSNNAQFQTIDILAGTLLSGQTLALNAIGTATTANLSYVFSSNFTVASGATLTVAPNVSVLLGPGVTLTDNGTVTFGNNDTVVLGVSGYNGAEQIVVGSGGVLTASGTGFSAPLYYNFPYSNTGTISVVAGGQFIANGDTFTLTTVTLSSGSADTIQYNTFACQLAINSGASFTIHQNDLTNVPGSNNGILASGTSTATIDLTNNYWGTTVAAQIAAKIMDHTTNAALPTVLYTPYLSLEPAQTTAAAASAAYNTAAQNVTLSATVAGPAGLVSQGTETFTILSGANTIGNPVTVNVSSGAASATYALPAATAPGTYTIQAVYSGTSFFSSATDSSHSLTVGTATTTTAAANASTTYAVGSQSVSLSASVTSPAGTVNGGTETFTILSGSTPVGNAVTVNVSSGAASASYTLPAATAVGTYTIQAVYNGTTNFGGSTDTGHSLIIGAAAISWTGNAGTLNWSDAANWSNNAVPGSVNDVTISKSGVGTITIGAGTYAVHSLNDTTAVLSIASGGTLSLAAVNATSTFGQNVTVQSGATLTVGGGASVLIGTAFGTTQTLADYGTVTFGAGDVVTLAASPTYYANPATAQIVVYSGGLLNVSGATLNSSIGSPSSGGATGSTLIAVNSGGHLQATNSTFSLSYVSLAIGAVFNAGDLTGNGFDLPLYIPAIDVQYLANNLRFQDININPDTLTSGQTLALNAIGTQTTTNLRYVFDGSFTVNGGAAVTVAANVRSVLESNFTVASGASVTFGPSDPVLIGTAFGTTQTLADYGTVTFGAGDVVTLAASPTYYANPATAQIVVYSGGLLSASGATVNSSIGSPSSGGATGSTLIAVNSGGHLQATNSTFSLSYVSLAIGAVFNAGDLTGNGFDLPLYIPAIDVQYLANNLRFQDININPDTLTSGQTLALNAIGTQTTTNLRYLFAGSFTVNGGAAVTVAANVRCVLESNFTVASGASVTFGPSDPVLIGTAFGTTQTLADYGTVTFGAGDVVTLAASPTYYANPATAQIVVYSGGLLSASGATVNSSIGSPSSGGATGSTLIAVNSGGHLQATNSTFSLSYVSLAIGAVFNAGDLTGNGFDLPLYIPAIDVQYLANNLRFQDININPDTLTSGQTLALNAIGTQTTTNLRYLFAGSFTVNGGAAVTVAANVRSVLGSNFTVASGASVTFGPSDPVLIGTAFGTTQTLADYGTVTFGAGDVVTLAASPTYYANPATAQIVVYSGGLLSVSGATVNSSIGSPSSGGATGSTLIAVNSGGHLQATNSTFSLSYVSLAIGAVFNAGDLTGNGFDLPLYIPAIDVQYLANNLRFQDININPDTLTSGQTLALNAIGTQTTTNLRYLFAGSFTVNGGAAVTVAANVRSVLGSNFTVASGASVTFGPSDPVLIGTAFGTTQTLADYGIVTFGAGDVVTLAASPTYYANPATAQIVVYSGGLLNVSGATVNSSIGSPSSGGATGSTLIAVNSGGHLQATNSTFSLSYVSLAIGAVFNAGDLTGNGFDLPLYIPAIDVQYLANNLRFQDINIDPDTLTSGQTLALNAIGTQTTTNLRYLFAGSFTVNGGAAVTVAANVRCVLESNFTVASGASVTFGPSDPVLIGTAFGTTQTLADSGIVTFGAGDVVTLAASPTYYANPATAQIVVYSGGLLSVSGATVNSSIGSPSSGGATGSTLIAVNSGGHLQATNSTFAISSLTLNSNSTDSLGASIFVTQLAINSGAFVTISGNDFTNGTVIASGNPNATINLSNNYWGTTNTTQIAAKITDHVTNSNLPTVSYNPFLSASASAISGLVFNDFNSNGVQDSGEPGLAGVTVYLDANNSGVYASGDPTAVTNASGQYGFYGLTAGTYIVREVVPSGAVITDPSAAQVQTTVYFDNSGAEAGITKSGTTNFSYQNASFSGGTVFAPSPSNLLASGTQAYNVSAGNAEVDFTLPVSTANFFYVYGSGYASGTATAYGADGTTLGTVNSNAATTNNAPANFVTMGPFSEPIARITFSGGVIDTFTFTTAANNQGYFVRLGAGQSTGGINFGTPMTEDAGTNASVAFNTAAQNVTLSATATSPYGVVNAGTVTFTVLNGGTTVGSPVTSGTVVAGAASAVYSLPAGEPPGTYTIQAAYNGTASFQSASDATHLLQVSAATTTTTALSATATFNGLSSQNVALSATATSAAGTVNEGTVTFTILSGGTVIGNPVVANVGAGAAGGSYTLPAGSPGGTYTIQAVYNDVGNYSGSTDASHSLTVNAASASTASSSITAVYSAATQSVTLGASVTSSAGAINQGTETFTILSGSTVIGTPVTVNVTNGAASAVYPLPAGATPATYTINAVYNGTSSFGTSTDASHSLTINSAPAATVSVSLDAHTDSGAPDYPAYTNYSAPTFDVQVNQAGTITVAFDSNPAHNQTQTVTTAGTYQFTAPSLADGAYTTTATFNAGAAGTPQSTTNYTIDTARPQVAAMTPSGTVNTTVSQVLVTFSEPVDLLTFPPATITLTGPAGVISVNQPQLVSGSTYSIGFATQAAQGAYTLTIAASVTDYAGNRLNQASNNSFTMALPDLAVTSSSAPPSAAEGASIPVSWQVANLSSTNPTGAAWTDAVYVSPHSVLDSSAVRLTSVAGPASPLAPNSGYARNMTVTLPGNLAVGNDYLLFVTDDNGGQAESNSANDVAAQPIVLSAADLQVTGVSGPVTGFTGQTVTVSWTDVNTGTATATGPWVDNVYTASSANGGNPLTLVGSFVFGGSLAAGASVPLTQQVILAQAGMQWFEVTTNATQTVVVANASNNTTVVTGSTSITAVSLPDLVVTSITPPANGVFSGTSVPVSFVVKNQGQGATSAASWQDWVLLSQNANLGQTYQGQLNATGPGGDQTLNSQPVVLGFSNPSYLGVGQSYQQNVNVSLPISAQGVWYVYVVPDGTGAAHPFAMPEASRTDKLKISAVFSITLSPPPDLAVSNVQAPAQDFSGQPMALRWTVSNTGQGPTVASAWTDAVYMSPTATLSASATLLATFLHQGVLTAGAGYTSNQTVTLPVAVSGSFYFVVKTDLNGQVFENGATANNVAATSAAETVNLTPPPDLTVSAITTPATALAGHGFTFSYTVKNGGAGATPNYTWNDALYLSPTATFQAGTAISLGQQNHQGSLAAGASYTNTVTTTLPNGLAGSYYLVVNTDSGSAVFELNKTNNLVVSTGTINVSVAPADLVVSAASAPAAALPGSAILVNWTVANQSTGNTAVSAWQDSVYIDTGSSLSSHAVLLGTFEHYGLVSGGGSYKQSQLVTLPISLLGSYHVFVVTNSAGDVYESNTSNNTSGPVPISISLQVSSGGTVKQAQVSDLQVITVTGSAIGATGSNITVNWTVKNIGSGATDANSWDDDVWMSTNTTLGSGGTDVYLGTVQHNNPLASGASYATAGTFPLPGTLTAGHYYFIVAVDRPVAPPGSYEGANLVYETNYANNVLAASSTTAVSTGATPNLTVAGVTAPVTATAGQQLAVGWTVTNQGSATGTVPITDSVYLSYDKVLDATDRYLGSVTHQGGLGAAANYTQNASIALPAGLTGTFYVFVVTNSDMSIFEQNSSNTSAYASQAVQIQLAPAADLVAGTVTTSTTALAGQNVTITYQVTNSGGQAANGSWSDALYLSPTQTWNVSDPLLGIVSQTQNLAPAGGYTGTLTASVPGVAPGSYYVILRTNILDNLAEQTLSNNQSASLMQTAIDAPALTLGQPTNGALNQGQSVYYKAVVSAGQTLQVGLTGGAAAHNELYVSFGTMPTRSTYDYRYSQAFAANQQITIPTTQAGAYYLLAYGDTVPSPPENYSITAAVIPFSIQAVTPGQAGAGPVTLQISGAQFAFATAFQLRNAHGTIFPATRTLLQDSATALATFNLTGLALGAYDVWAVQSNGTSTKLSAGLNVVAAAPNSVQVALVVPQAVLVGHPGTVTVTYSNPGNTDLPAPLILLSGNNALFQVPGQPGDTSSTLQLFGFNPAGPFGTLPPGFQGSVAVSFTPVTAGAGLLSTFTLQTLNNPSQPFDWNAFTANDIPLNTSPQQWSAMVSQAAPLLGSTWGAIVSFLDNNSVQLVKNAGPKTDPNALNSLYNFDGLLQYVVGVYGAPTPVAPATPAFPVVATEGEVTVYNANGNAAPLNSSYPTFVIIPGLNGYQADSGNLAAAIAADTASFPSGQVNVLVAVWQGATAGPTMNGVNVPWMAALHVDIDGGELGDILTSLQQQGKISLSATTIVSEDLGDDVGNQAAKIAGGLGNAVALNPASALSGYLPSALTTYFQQSIAYETSSFLDTPLGIAASNQTLSTGDDNNPLLQHTSGVPWLTGQILAGNDALLNPSNTTGPGALPPGNAPPPPSSPAGLLVSSAEVEQIISHDPNSIVGPKGSGTSAMVPIDEPLPYTIDFSNTSQGPAQEIDISEPIDPNLNEGTFRPTSFGFDGITYSILEDGAWYQATIDLTDQLQVLFTATIDASTDRAKWTFEAIDPTTGQVPQDPTVGLLPADGTGFVSYTIMPTSTDATGTTISAQAAVTFDTQPPLDTNTTSNTVDSGAGLTSSVATLPAFENSPFPVSWSGSDTSNGSGLANYTIYVSDNGGPYTAWLQNTTLTSAPFVGQDSHTYSFYSVAADNTGNLQATPTTAQTTTEVDATPPTTTAFSFPAPGASYNASQWTGTIAGSASDGISGVQQEQVSILDVATNLYWNGSAFASSTEVFFPATLASPGANFTPWSVPFPTSDFPADGSYTVHAEGTDVVGNVEVAGLLATFNYLTTPPTTTDSLSGTPGSSGYRSAVTVTLTATDAVSGVVAATYYTIDGVSQPPYSSPFTVSGPGPHTITFWSVDLAGNTEAPPKSASFTIAAVSLSLSNFVAPPSSVPVGGHSIITFAAVDANSNPVSGASVAFGLASGSAGGTFGAVTDNGNGTYSASFTAGTQAGSDTLTATIYGQPVTSTAPTLTVTPGPANQLVFGVQPSGNTTAGAAMSPAVTVKIEDAFGNFVTTDNTDQVTVGIASGPGSFSGASTTTVTASGGIATFSNLHLNTAGTYTLRETASGSLVGPASSNFTITSAAANQLAFGQQPANTAAGSTLAPAVTVKIEDAFGNFVSTDNSDVVTVAATGPGNFTGGSTTSVTASGGSATFSNLALGSAGSYTLSASATGGLTGPASSTFNITLVVISGGFVANPTGFTVTFSQAVNPATINLTGPTGTDGPVAVTLVGSGSIGAISGSLYLDPTDTKLTFVKTVVVGANGLPVSTGSLPLGTYTVTLVSGSTALTTTNGVALDGNGDGVAGDNYTATFHVVSSSPAPGDVLLPSTTVLATAPDFARGPLTPSETIAGTSGATESGNTVTITTTLAHAFSVGQTVTIAGVGLSGFNGTFTITSVPSSPNVSGSPTTFTYTDPTSGLANAGGGTANVLAVNVANNSSNGIPIDLTVLAPVQTVTFSSAISTGTTGTFKLGFNSQTTANITVGTAIKAQTASASTSGASESGTTVTIRTATATGLKVGESVTINGVGVSGYNGTFTVTTVPTTTSFTYTASTSGLALSGAGTWNLSGGTALATAIQNALGALSVVGGTANVAVTGTGPFTVTFAGAVANPNLMTVAANTISGAPTLTIVNPNAPANVTDATLVLSYNANLLNITGGTVNASLPGSPTFTVNTSGNGTAAQATITFHSSSGVNLGTLGSVDLGGLVATVPSTAAYKSKMLLHFVSESLNGGALTAAGVDGYQVVAYQGDTDGNGSFSGNDQTLLNAVAGGSSPGFAAYRQVDPVLLGGLTSGTSVSATDSGLLASYLNGVAIPQVPDQTGVTPSLFAPGPDPTVSIPTGLVVGADGTVVVPVMLDDARPAGSTGLTQAELALTYDPAAFTVTAADVHLGTIPSSGSGWTLSTVVDAVTGQLAITLLSQTPISTSLGGSLVTIALHRTGTALSGTTPITLAASVDPNGQGMFPTALFDTDNRFILSPAPTNAASDADARARLEVSPATSAVLVRPDGDTSATSAPVAPALDSQRLATAPQAAEAQSLTTEAGAGVSEAVTDPARPSVLRSVRSDDLAADMLPMLPATVGMVAAPAVSLTSFSGAPVLVNPLTDRLLLAGTPARWDPASPWPGAGAMEDSLDTLLAGVWVRSRSARDTFDSQVWDAATLDDLVPVPAPTSQADGTRALGREWVNDAAPGQTLSDEDGDVLP